MNGHGPCGYIRVYRHAAGHSFQVDSDNIEIEMRRKNETKNIKSSIDEEFHACLRHLIDYLFRCWFWARSRGLVGPPEPGKSGAGRLSSSA